MEGFICRWEGGELGKVSSEVGRWERWENSEVAQSERWEGSEVSIWERWRGGELVRWQGGKDGRLVMWQGGRFPVLFRDGGRRVRPRFRLFVSDANQ